MSGERLNKFLARRGVSSRRGADDLISAGRVTINGVTAELGSTVEPTDAVLVDGAEVAASPAPATYMLNKPPGVVSTRRDPQRRRTVMDMVERVAGLVPVGRLDADSRGLLLLSNDGELTHRLTHPRHGVTKVYHVRLRESPDSKKLDVLERGVALDDGPAQPIRVAIVDHAKHHVIEIEMGEGRNREVRRMCAAAGLDITDLRRVSFGPLKLGDLREGESRHLSSRETAALYAVAGLPSPRRGA